MKIQIRWLMMVAACALLATTVASDGAGHGTSRRSRLRYIMHHRTGCGGGLVVASPQKHEKKEPVILSYRPDRADHFLFARDRESRLARLPVGWSKKFDEYIAVLNTTDSCSVQTDDWKRAFFEAATWRFPQNGPTFVARKFFKAKAEWTRKAFHNGSWEAEPIKVLEASVEVLTEVAEWGFRKERAKKVLPQTGEFFLLECPESQPARPS